MDLWSWLSGGFGIDLGTANTVVCHPHRGIVLNEPSVMLQRDGAKGVKAAKKRTLVGQEAREMIGRTPPGMAVIRPLRDGVITDLQSAQTFILAIIRLIAHEPWERLRPRAIIGVPAGASALERRAVLEAAEEAGLGSVALLPEPIAGAVGAGLDPLAPRAQMVVDVGGGTAEVTGFCLGGILTTRSCRVAGDEMTFALDQHLRTQHQIVVGELTAESVKMRVDGHRNGSLVVEGRDAGTGRPRVVTLEPEEVVAAIRPTSDSIIQTLATCLEDLPPQAVGDVMRSGLVLIGGGSMLKGFGELLEDAFGFPVRRADSPLTCVAEGACAALRLPDVMAAYGPD